MSRVLCVFWVLFGAVSCQSSTEALYQSIMKEYNKKILPPVAAALDVTMDMPVLMLIHVLEDEQLAKFVMADYKSWTDERLKWNPEAFGNQTSIVVSEKDVWLPPIVIYNTVEFKALIIDDVRTVKIESDGRVSWNLHVTITTTCNLRVDYFPFDVQVCTIYATSPSYDDGQLAAVAGATQNYYGNAEWVALNASIDVQHFSELGTPRFDVRYHLQIRRNFVYYLIVIVAPTFLLSVLTTAGIFTARGTSEVIGIGLSSLLALSVMLGIVAESLPKSNNVTVMGYYLLLSMFLAALSIVAAVAISVARERRIKFRRTPPSQAWYSLVCVKRPVQMDKVFKGKEWNVSAAISSIPSGDNARCVDDSMLDLIHAQIRSLNEAFHAILQKQERDKHAQKIASEWHRVFHRITVAAVTMFQAANIILLAVFLSFISENAKIPPIPPYDLAVL